ncbi:hypothetical protein JVU11DRAFT_4080 [Chiua virens]|nr:hypothetical protein JVU11DRAFT_4080 [Chiua virens]
MNLITSDAAYSLYPLATLVERTGLGMPNSMNGPNAPAAISKYIQRGWRIYFTPRPEDLERPLEPPFVLKNRRWIGDKYTWVVPLDQTGVKPRPPLSPGSQPLKFDPVLCYGWQLQPVSQHETQNTYECKTYTVQSTVFRYNYAFPDEKLANAIIHWTARQGKYCHLYIDKEDWMWYVSFSCAMIIM